MNLFSLRIQIENKKKLFWGSWGGGSWRKFIVFTINPNLKFSFSEGGGDGGGELK